MRLHFIPNTHIDPVWLWDQYEGIDEVLNTFRSVCDRLDEYPTLTFSASSLRFLEWVEEFEPPLFRRIAEFIGSGRWEIVGDWWVEADSNLPGSIGLKKQVEIARGYAVKKFGKTSEVAFLPDGFGHPADLPKTLAEDGFKYLVFCRPSPDENPRLPSNLFYWTFKEHRILAYRPKHHYFQEDKSDEARLKRLEDPEFQELPVNAFFFGLGNHGGGPSIEEIECFGGFIESRPEGDAAFSSCAAFFEDAERAGGIPEFSGDLQPHAVGCYSVMRDLKHKIRSAEGVLSYAERAENMAGRPLSDKESLWKSVLFNQFHDILPGSSSPGAADHARQELDGALHEARNAGYRALKSISLNHPVKVRTGEFRVFNTLPYPVTVPISMESFVYYVSGSPFRKDDGKEITIQSITPDVRCSTTRWAFVDTLPAGGFNVYAFDGAGLRLPPEPTDRIFSHINNAESSAFVSEHARASIRFGIIDDESDTWGHKVAGYDNYTGEFTLDESGIVRGPVADQLHQRYSFNRSEVECVFSRYHGVEGLMLDIRVRWFEKQRILKMILDPLASTFDKISMQGSSDVLSRPADGTELPMHRWVWLPGGLGYGIVQDGAFACDASEDTLRITLVRSNVYAWLDRWPIHLSDPQRYTDLGEHHFRFHLLPDQAFSKEKLDRLGEIWIEPFPVVRESG